MSLTYRMAMTDFKEGKEDALRLQSKRKIKVCVAKGWVEVGDGSLPWIYSTCDFEIGEKIKVGSIEYYIRDVYMDYKTRQPGKRDRGVVVYEAQEIALFQKGDMVSSRRKNDTKNITILEVLEDENIYKIRLEDGKEGFVRIEKQHLLKKNKPK